MAELPRRILLGSGRSATTWVLDCLAKANSLRPIFEPLHPIHSPLGKEFAHRVMMQGDRDDRLEQFFSRLAEGEIHTRWIDFRAPNDLLFPQPRRLLDVAFAKRWVRVWRSYFRDMIAYRASARREQTLIKCIRATLMAGWLQNDLGFKVALIVRHPCAAIESQHRAGKSWNPNRLIDQYRRDEKLHEFTNNRYREILNSDLTLLEALTLNWVIENQQAVENAATEGYSVISSEHLVMDPDESWPKLCNALDLEAIPGSDLLSAPSQQASDKSRTDSDGRRWKEPNWRKALKDDQLSSIRRILDATQCDIYSVDQNMPNLPVQ